MCESGVNASFLSNYILNTIRLLDYMLIITVREWEEKSIIIMGKEEEEGMIINKG